MIVPAVSHLPFGAADLLLLGLGVAVLLALGVAARWALDIAARSRGSAVAERHAGRVHGLRPLTETASGGHPGEQA